MVLLLLRGPRRVVLGFVREDENGDPTILVAWSWLLSIWWRNYRGCHHLYQFEERLRRSGWSIFSDLALTQNARSDELRRQLAACT
ncbi:hypothetical protein Pla144_17690 [Bythopirellula polymerisocia]|uniref:Uncharacterized protein n=1 Tax=Bythopirellula polymerisocia TaxID=2528003 RepID=A0A5C6D0S4_9BACT|nr:hypothetical protein Pla144_17690 [Bythopirellula polymerisocia]